ncbi:hypothetical protein [Helicobacter sp. 13S00477-4]|uniref:hypothetical protein n=1 Tax=Helicobacter sp. 13S00477-4 TaxID=1905759 RepID=UPI000BA5F310|nr:hypothetical protein [Helicobacter sp. 13S00477-4]PAF50863.1 hypothetical protein BKH44_06865 [Helicobacter sp. 13S00477-4]
MSLEKDLSKHIQKSLNKAIIKVAKEQAKAIREGFDLPDKKIKSLTMIKKASLYNLKASILGFSGRVSIKHFKKSKVMQGRKIIGVNVKLNQSSKVFLNGHFIAKNRDKQGEFIAIRENSKHMKNPNFEYKKSSKAYASFSGTQKLLYPLSSKPFCQIAKEKSQSLMPKVKEIFMKELDR